MSSRRKFWSGIVAAASGAAMISAVLIWFPGEGNITARVLIGAVTTLLVSLMGALFILAYLSPPASNETQARYRVRQAEDKLADSLRQHSPGELLELAEKIANDITDCKAQESYDDRLPGPERTNRIEVIQPNRITPENADAIVRVVANRADERLTLAALWDVTHGRMDLYHTIVTGQAKRSFGAAQAAMVIGFAMLVGFAVLAAEAKTTTAAVSAGSLGAVGAAFAAYIGKTFIRSQETAASHLRAYFDQPLELSRYLAAERLLADDKSLSAEQRAAILSSLVESIATAGQGDKKDPQPTDRPKGRAQLG